MSDDVKLRFIRAYNGEEHFARQTWSTYRIDDKNRQAVNLVRSMQLAKVPGAFISGKAGSGKTHLMRCVFNHLVDWKVELHDRGDASTVYPFWVNMSWYLEQLRHEKWQVKGRAKSAPILFLDDIGTSTKTDWVVDQVLSLIDHRAEFGLQTFATSNMNLQDLEPIYGARVVSRLCALMIPVEVDGHDQRKRQMQLNFESVVRDMNKNKPGPMNGADEKEK